MAYIYVLLSGSLLFCADTLHGVARNESIARKNEYLMIVLNIFAINSSFITKITSKTECLNENVIFAI